MEAIRDRLTTGQSLTQIAREVVHDSNNLGDPPQRRINMSMVDNGERKLTVLNATAEETSPVPTDLAPFTGPSPQM